MVINQKFFINGFKGLIHKAPNMDTLVALGSGASFAYSTYALFAMTDAQMRGNMAGVMEYMHEFYFESAAMILTLITVGKMLEARSKGKTTDALKGLMKLAPKTAVVVQNGEEVTVGIEEVRIGDRPVALTRTEFELLTTLASNPSRVFSREDLIGEPQAGTPTMFTYKVHAENDSMYNTPPCYSIYMCKLVLEWIQNEVGGLEAMENRNVEKAGLLYDFLDRSKLFKGCAEKDSRSIMNVTFVTGDKDLDAKFVKEAADAGFVNLKGHRSVGGMRASIYNAMPRAGVEKLVEFMEKFEKENA